MAPESAEEIRRKLAELADSYAHELESSEAEFVTVARQAVGGSRHGWLDGGLAKRLGIERMVRSKFTVCFPMAAHAINYVAVASSSGAKLSSELAAKQATRSAVPAQIPRSANAMPRV